MKVVVIVPDRNITVDNRMLVLDQHDWNFDDSHIHAIHWNETSGELEYVDTSCLLYTSPSPRDATLSRMPSSA